MCPPAVPTPTLAIPSPLHALGTSYWRTTLIRPHATRREEPRVAFARTHSSTSASVSARVRKYDAQRIATNRARPESPRLRSRHHIPRRDTAAHSVPRARLVAAVRWAPELAPPLPYSPAADSGGGDSPRRTPAPGVVLYAPSPTPFLVLFAWTAGWASSAASALAADVSLHTSRAAWESRPRWAGSAAPCRLSSWPPHWPPREDEARRSRHSNSNGPVTSSTEPVWSESRQENRREGKWWNLTRGRKDTGVSAKDARQSVSGILGFPPLPAGAAAILAPPRRLRVLRPNIPPTATTQRAEAESLHHRILNSERGTSSDHEHESGLSSYYNNKTTIIQEARVFNESPISARKCRALLTHIVYLLYVGETFSAQEATTLFFGTTKLFQHKDSALRQAVYLAIKELATTTEDVVKRWVNEAQEAVNAKSGSYFGATVTGGSFFGGGGQGATQTVPSSSNITQYHALGLLYLIRQQDRMAVTKMIQQLGGGKSGAGTTLKNAMALCMLIRYAAKVMEEDPNVQRQMVELLEGWLRHKSDLVNFEAARLFLSSPKPVLKFAATRTLAALALPRTPQASRSVATYAITTLLKTGNEASVDRLIKQITGFMSEISDEFKVIIVEAIRSLCLKFPAKHAAMVTFLSGVLRDEGGYDFKRAVVEAIFDMIKFIGECKEQAFSHLCEFIEDCEFTKLSWDRLKGGPSATETCGLGTAVESLKAACDSIVEVLNMELLGGTEVPTSTSVHALQLSGLVTGGGGKVLVRCRMTFSQGVGITLELEVRAEKQDVCQLVVNAVGG
ncbi:armadillo-type protein [Mycena metata]|uniref:Armadillo-type protein n=1 Tax=Mycena metata TaxID=1033252 RepID=A0AAD7KFU4_9AGAR|nr:armadillo-type protein [Mycena metata]